MATIEALFVSKNGIAAPEAAPDALRVDTGETKAVYEVEWVELADMDAVDAYLANIPEGYIHTRQDPYPVTETVGDETVITGYRLRMKHLVDRPVVTGGWKTIDDYGEYKLHDVQCDLDSLTALHTAVQDANDGAGGAILMQSAADYTPLPAMGEQVTAGVIYNDGGDLVVARQSHTRTEHDVSDIPALFAVWRSGADGTLDWVAQERVEVGMQRIYDGVLYVCLQAHQTQDAWMPPTVPALWAAVVEPSAEWTAGVAYTVGDQVTYAGTLYECRQSHTAQIGWEPPNVLALWLPI